MKSLREVAEFVAETPSGFSMRSVGDSVPALSGEERTSLRAMIAGLQRLPPVTLDAEIVGGPHLKSGVVSVRVHPTKGATRRTTYTVFLPTGAQEPALTTQDIRGHFEGVLTLGSFGSGRWELRVTRTGTGPIRLDKTLPFSVTAPPGPPPPVVKPPPPPAAVTCQAEMDLDEPGFGGVTGVRIFGGGFQVGEPVEIIEGQNLAATTKAVAFGQYSVRIGVLQATPPVLHRYRAHGRTNGKTSNEAGFTV